MAKPIPLPSPPPTITILIIGGGPIGLTTSLLLSHTSPSTPHLLFSRHASTSIHPKAVGLNQRTVETFARLGVLDAIYAASGPVSRCQRTAWYTSFGPRGREICSRDAWGGGPYADEYARASPERYVNLPQIRLEPILKEAAERRNPGGVLFGFDVTEVVEDGGGEGVLVKVLRREDGRRFDVRAQYVVGADGGRFLADVLGIAWEGERDIVHMVSAHIQAPISSYHPDPSIFLSWFINPELGGSLNTGYLYHLGPYTNKQGSVWGTDTDTEEWMFACGVLPHESEAFTEEDMRRRIDAVLRVPGLSDKVEVLSLVHWHVHAIVTQRYRSPKGRIFLVGDAAHRIPPWGALGLNTGIGDAENLVWKLSMALNASQKGLQHSFNGLLDTYEAERRPIGLRVARDSLHNMRSHALVLDTAIGIHPTNSVQENVQAMDTYFDQGSTQGAQQRQSVQEALHVLDLEFHEHGTEIGWFYPSADARGEGAESRHDGQLDEQGNHVVRTYHPSTIPGHHLPHAWLSNGEGQRLSTRRLLDADRFVLIAAKASWKAVKHDMMHVVITGEEGDWCDQSGIWKGLRGVDEDGALLIRPDGIIGYRWQDDAFLNEGDLDRRFGLLIDNLLKNA
jgi:2-polyprenyl-6-methoxyphenol hydroxylase-like FAD-dependent oxidoreductase